MPVEKGDIAHGAAQSNSCADLITISVQITKAEIIK